MYTIVASDNVFALQMTALCLTAYTAGVLAMLSTVCLLHQSPLAPSALRSSLESAIHRGKAEDGALKTYENGNEDEKVIFSSDRLRAMVDEGDELDGEVLERVAGLDEQGEKRLERAPSTLFFL